MLHEGLSLAFERLVERHKKRICRPFSCDVGVRTVARDDSDVAVKLHELSEDAAHQRVVVGPLVICAAYAAGEQSVSAEKDLFVTFQIADASRGVARSLYDFESQTADFDPVTFLYVTDAVARSAGVRGYAALARSVRHITARSLMARSAGVRGYAALAHSVRHIAVRSLVARSEERFRSLQTEGLAQCGIRLVYDDLVRRMHIYGNIEMLCRFCRSEDVVEVSVSEKNSLDFETFAVNGTVKPFPFLRIVESGVDDYAVPVLVPGYAAPFLKDVESEIFYMHLSIISNKHTKIQKELLNLLFDVDKLKQRLCILR